MKTERESDVKVVRNYYGLTWPTLVTGAIVVLTIALSYLWLAAFAIKAGD